MMTSDENTIQTRFLLGKLSEDERSEIEREFLTDGKAFDELLIAENSLFDAYVSDTLRDEDRSAFEQRLLMTPRQKARAAFAGDLIRYAKRAKVNQAAAAEGNQAGVLARITEFFRGGLALNYAAAAACLALVFGSAVWWASNRDGSSGRNEVAIHNPQIEQRQSPAQGLPSQPVDIPPTDPQRAPAADKPIAKKPAETKPRPTVAAPRNVPSVIATFVLPLAATRGNGGTAFVVPRNASIVQLQMAAGEEARRHYFAVVETVDGQQIWRGKAKAAKGGNSIAIFVPGRSLSPGDYIVTIKGSDTKDSFETIGESAFTIAQKPDRKR